MKQHAWHLVTGLGLWLTWFCITYGGLAVACAVTPPSSALGAWTWLNAAVLLLAALCMAGYGAAAWASSRAARRAQEEGTGARQRFLASSATALYVTAVLCTAAVALPAVLLGPCV